MVLARAGSTVVDCVCAATGSAPETPFDALANVASSPVRDAEPAIVAERVTLGVDIILTKIPNPLRSALTLETSHQVCAHAIVLARRGKAGIHHVDCAFRASPRLEA